MAYNTSRPAPADVPLTKNRITGAASTIVENNLSANRIMLTDAGGKVSSAPALTANRLLKSDSNGQPAIINAITANRALASDANGYPVHATTTSSELNLIAGSTSRDTSNTPEDADGVLMNDNGTMRMLAFSRVWEWMKLKFTGAISGLLTTNLTASKILVSDANGKIAANGAPATLLSNLSEFVGVSKFITQARPSSGSTVVQLMTASIRTITLDLEVTATATNIRAYQDASSGMQLFKVNAVTTTSSCTRTSVVNGGTIATMGSTINSNSWFEGVIYADGDSTSYVNFRIMMTNPLSTATWVKIDIW